MNSPSSDGKGTKRDEVKDIERQIGKVPKGYERIELPSDLEAIWSIYCDLYSVGEVNFSTIKDYKDLYSLNMKPYEIDLLTEIERARIWTQQSYS